MTASHIDYLAVGVFLVKNLGRNRGNVGNRVGGKLFRLEVNLASPSLFFQSSWGQDRVVQLAVTDQPFVSKVLGDIVVSQAGKFCLALPLVRVGREN